MKKKETIVVFCAHNDDQIVGVGGTLAKYAEEGKKVYTAIFSYGESSHPHLKDYVTRNMRIKEAARSDKVLGGTGIYYFGLREGSFPKGIEENKVKKSIAQIIKKRNPSKIFTHSSDDPHPDHRAVNKVMNEILDEINYKGDVYSFDVWNFVKLKERDNPKLVVDISKTFHKKVDSFKEHRSQKASIISLMWSIYLKAIVNGFNNHCRYAEVFYKIR